MILKYILKTRVREDVLALNCSASGQAAMATCYKHVNQFQIPYNSQNFSAS